MEKKNIGDLRNAFASGALIGIGSLKVTEFACSTLEKTGDYSEGRLIMLGASLLAVLFFGFQSVALYFLTRPDKKPVDPAQPSRQP